MYQFLIIAYLFTLLDRGINYDVIKAFPRVSVLHLLGKQEKWLEARLAAGKEIQKLAPRAAKIKQKRHAGEPIMKEEEHVFNRRHALG